MKRHLQLVLGMGVMCLLAARASDVEPSMTRTEGAIRTWRSAEGFLPADSVTAIIQTREGFLWVGTSAGLVRFDGVKFTAVPLFDSATNRMIYVTALCEDSRGYLWIGTQQDGVFKLAHGRATQWTKADGLQDNSVTSLAADDQGFVWIGTKAGVVFAGRKEVRAFTTRDGLPDDLVTGLHVARSGTVWITTRGGMCQFTNGQIAPYALETESRGRSPEYLGAYEDPHGNSWAYGDTYLINLAPEGKRLNRFLGNEATRIWSLCGGRDGRLWIGTGRGLYYFDRDHFQPVVPGELGWPYGVRAICEDREGNVWLGTSGSGLVQLFPQQIHTVRTGQGLADARPTALALDTSGRVLVGLQRGGLFMTEGERFEAFNPGGMGVEDFVSSLCVGRDGAIWAGTLCGGLYAFHGGRRVQMTTANGLADDAVLSVCADAQGGIWAGTGAGTVHRFADGTSSSFGAKHGLPGSGVTVIILSSGGGVWLGTEDGSILRGEPGRFALALPGEKLDHRPILALHEGERGRLWIGTHGAGLACLGQGQMLRWSTANGLPNDIVSAVVRDPEKNIWLATGSGVCRADRGAVERSLTNSQAALVCRLMSDAKTTDEPTALFGGRRALLGPEGKLWFATSDGVLNVDAQKAEVESSSLPICLESVAFNGDAPRSLLYHAPWSEAASNGVPALHGRVTSLDVRFTALSFFAPEKIHFRHMLEGFDSDWVDDAANRFAHYGRLPYGHFQLHVAARNGDGPWQEAVAPLAFDVPTPIYFRAWAIVGYAVFAVGLVAGVVRLVSHRRLRRALVRLEQQQTLERERMRIARDMHDEIGSKLTKISFLSEHAKVDAEPGPLAKKIESIAETSRDLLQTMDEIVWVVNPHNDTLEQLAAYLSHYAAEYFQTTSVECDLRLPPAIPHHPLSSEARHNLFLTFEEALNNVLKHSAASRVNIEMSVKRLEFEINVADNGHGFESSAFASGNGSPQSNGNGRSGNGLRNMRQRLMDIGGECLIHSRPGAGTTVSLHIPLTDSAAKA